MRPTTSWILVLMVSVVSVALPLPIVRADEPTSASDEIQESVVPEPLADAWRTGAWERAHELTRRGSVSWRASDRRVLEAALVLRLPAASVLAIDRGEVAEAFDEIGEIEVQRTAAHVMGAFGGIVMAVGIGLGASSNFLLDEGIIRGIAGWAVCGAGGLLALVATVFQIDVPFRWQRWAASLGGR